MICPPVEEKFPGVMAVLSALKKYCRGPSELKSSTVLVELNGSGKGPVGLGGGPAAVEAGVAATPKAFAPGGALWPCVEPCVLNVSLARFVSRCRKRSEPENLTMTARKLVRLPDTPTNSKGSCVPFWVLV